MQPTRRIILFWITGLLAVGNLSLLLLLNVPRKQELVTYVGLDSASYFVPMRRVASAYRHRRWKPGLDETRLSPDPVDYVTLAPEPNYGHFIEIIRDLKKRHRCHVLVHYPGIAVVEPESVGVERVFDVPVLGLCGNPLGDAGNQESVPEDRFITAGNAAPAIARHPIENA